MRVLLAAKGSLCRAVLICTLARPRLRPLQVPFNQKVSIVDMTASTNRAHSYGRCLICGSHFPLMTHAGRMDRRHAPHLPGLLSDPPLWYRLERFLRCV